MIKGTREDEGLEEVGSKQIRKRGPWAYGEHEGRGLGAPLLPSYLDTEPLGGAPSEPTSQLQHPGPQDSLSQPFQT